MAGVVWATMVATGRDAEHAFLLTVQVYEDAVASDRQCVYPLGNSVDT
jgi:hypothetical protein